MNTSYPLWLEQVESNSFKRESCYTTGEQWLHFILNVVIEASYINASFATVLLAGFFLSAFFLFWEHFCCCFCVAESCFVRIGWFCVFVGLWISCCQLCFFAFREHLCVLHSLVINNIWCFLKKKVEKVWSGKSVHQLSRTYYIKDTLLVLHKLTNKIVLKRTLE